MLNFYLIIKDLIHYRYFKISVRTGKDFGNENSGLKNLTDFITSYYRLLVMSKCLSIKALRVSLPTLPKFNIYTPHRFFGGKAWD